MRPEIEPALAWLRERRSAMESLLGELVRLSSFTADRADVNAVVDRLARELARIGLEVERIPSATFGDHLSFRTRARGPPAFLIGHTDTVFPAGSFDGFRIEGDRGFGPGAYDMKGGLGVVLFALEALGRAGLLDRVAVAGLFVADEEVGSPESQPILTRLCRGAECALGFESGRPGDLIVTSRKGVASLSAEASGVAAHAGNEHEKGKNAIWSLCRFVDRVQGLTDYARGVTVNVGRIEGGTTKNTVPARARCEIDLRYLDAASADPLVERIQAAAREGAVPGTRIEVTRTAFRPPLLRSAASSALAAAFGACQSESGLGSGEAPLSGGGSDAATASAAGVPSIDGLGPRGAGFHSTREEVDLASLVPKAEALVRFLGSRIPSPSGRGSG